MAGEWSPKSLTPPRITRQAAQSDWIFYHGTPDERTWDQPHGAAYGLHIGTEEAARQALNSRIGRPLEGDWDGTREYGKTLLSPYQATGTGRDVDAPRYPSGRATYSTGHQVPMDARPSIFPVRITGPMIGHPAAPVEDTYANGRMRAQLTRGNARRGYFYRNTGEDEGSISAAVPSAAHLERVHPPREAARWSPSAGIFGPTTGLDPDLFDEHGRLRPDVRHCVMTRLDQCIRTDSGLAGSDWQDWTRVYLLGGSVSEWAGPRPNGTARDLDVIVAVDLHEAQRHSAFEGMDPGTAASALNAAFHRCFNDDHWRPSSGGEWALTAFCNQRAWDVTAIRPYAAYDLTHSRWSVRPPHLPEHSLADFDPAALRLARAVASEARAILALPEPARTREATALWRRLHEGRDAAFSGNGVGWADPGNLVEKWLAYNPGHLLEKIKDLVHPPRTAGFNGPLPELEYIHQAQGNGTHRLHALLPGHSHPDNAGKDMRPGVMSWDGDSGKIGWISILPDWRRRGIASEMFRRAQEITPHLRHGDLSSDAERWVAGMAKSAGSVHQAVLSPEAAPRSSLFIGERPAGHVIRQEEEAVPVSVDLTDKVGRSEGVQLHRSPAPDLDLDIRPRGILDRVIPQGPPVGAGGEGDLVRYENGFSPVNNGHVASVDANVQSRAPARAYPLESDGAFSVDQPGQPRQIGTISHTGIIHNPYLRNPYHGNPMFGGNPEWHSTWFHGTRGEPDFGTRRKDGDEARRAALPPEQRVMNSGWTQPNQHLGVHLSPLHEVGHKFAPSTWSGPTSIAHVRVRGSDPAHFRNEDHLNIAMADWASQHYPHWHNDKLNSSMAWNYSDQEGTHRDFSQVPQDPAQSYRMGQKAQSLLQWHPHMPEILQGFKAHLRSQGHHGITYGNDVEGPYDTDATRGGDASVKAIRKHENWPRGAPKSISAIADPEDIEVTHVEHIAPWRAEPEPHQRTWEDASEHDEPDAVRDRVLDWHRVHGGELPGRTAAVQNPPCHYCGEPLDDDDVDNGISSHEECQQMRWCEAHQEHHDDPMEAESHNDTYTDWNGHLPFEHGIHRGFPKQLPAEVHQAIHDESRPVTERAAILRDHLNDNPSEGMGLQRRLTDEEKHGQTGHFGVHWTDSEPHARGWAEDDMYEGPVGGGPKPSVTHVVLHAGSPDREHVEDDPEELERRHMYGFDHYRSEREVPLKVGAPVRLTGISWKHGGENEWTRHDFGDGHQVTAAADPDRYVDCEQGHTHWGALGAAGLLVRHREGDSGPYRYLLQKRSPDVQHGGTWSTPGGALQQGETPQEGAVREAGEEGIRLPEGTAHHHTFTDDHGGWAYHTVVMDSPRPFGPSGDENWESEGHGWFTPQQVKGLRLHPGFASSWDKVRKSAVVARTAAGDQGWQSWTGDQPHKAVIHQTQEAFRPGHPELTAPLDLHRDPIEDWPRHTRESEAGGQALRRILEAAGHPGAGHAWVEPHPHPERRVSQPAVDAQGHVGVALLPSRWDRATLAHEAAHIVHARQSGIDLAAMRHADADEHGVVDSGVPDHVMHGPEFARHYADALDVLSPGAGDDFLRHHAEKLVLVGNQRYRVHGLPREYEGSQPTRREAAAPAGGQQRPRRTPGNAMVYLSVPHGTVQPYAGQEGGHHVALAYLPRAIGDEDFARVVDRAREAATRHAPMKGTVGGHMTFPPGAPSDKRRVAVVPAEIPGVHRLQREFGEFDRAHYEQYTPHVTRAQLTGNDPDPEPHPEVRVPFTHIHVRRGDEVHSFPLTGEPIRREAAAEQGPRYYHGTRDAYQPGDQIEHHFWKKYPDRADFRENSPLYATTDPSLAGHMAELRGGAEGRMYEVRPTGPLRPDELANGVVRGNASWEARDPLHVVREVPRHEWPGDLNSWQMSQEEVYHRREAAAGGDEEPDYYHVSPHRLPYGTILRPPGRGAGNWDEDREGSHVYVTPHEHRADQYHYLLWQQGHRDLHVYQVQPHGKLEQDPNDVEGLRTKDPVEVIHHLYGHDENQADDDDDDDWFYKHAGRTAASGYDLEPRSGMIYLDLPPGTVRPVPGGVDDHHITLVYLGSGISDKAFEEACKRAKAAAAGCPPLEGVLRGIDIFPPSPSSDGKVVAFVPAYVGGIGRLYRELEDLSASEHKDPRPHCTLAYLGEGDGLPAPHPAVPLRFTHLHVKRGDDVVSFPLTGRAHE